MRTIRTLALAAMAALCALAQIQTINNEPLATARPKINGNFDYHETQINLRIIDPTTTTGDTVFRGVSGIQRRAIGTDGQCFVASGGVPVWTTCPGDFSSDTSTSVINELLVFADNSGKVAKRATGTGIAKIASGVLGTATIGTDYQAPIVGSCGAGNHISAVNATTGVATCSADSGGGGGGMTTGSGAPSTTPADGSMYGDTVGQDFYFRLGSAWLKALKTSGTASGVVTLSGLTSGSAQIGVADIAGSPAKVNIPTTTCAAGESWISDGANPQQYSCHATPLQFAFMYTPASGGVVQASDLATAIYGNGLGTTMTITALECWTDSGSLSLAVTGNSLALGTAACSATPTAQTTITNASVAASKTFSSAISGSVTGSPTYVILAVRYTR